MLSEKNKDISGLVSAEAGFCHHRNLETNLAKRNLILRDCVGVGIAYEGWDLPCGYKQNRVDNPT